MTWDNWASLANQILQWFINIFPSVLDMIMSHPLSGVPIVLMILGIVLSLAVKFLGVLGSYRGGSES